MIHALHEYGYYKLSPEQQDALIESGWHPGPNGGCGRRIKNGHCGMDGVCPSCWSERQFKDRVRPLLDALRYYAEGRIWDNGEIAREALGISEGKTPDPDWIASEAARLRRPGGVLPEDDPNEGLSEEFESGIMDDIARDRHSGQ